MNRAAPAPQKFMTGLIGRNILSSRSPWLHEQEAKAQGVLLTYALFDFTALGRADSDLPKFLDAAQMLGFSGLNITFPFKLTVLAYLDEIEPSAAQLGAVNAVQFTDGKRIGHNTDLAGFAESLRTGLPAAKLGTVTQFGAGGAGSATAHALLSLGVQQLIIIDRDIAKRDALVARLCAQFGAKRAVGGSDERDAVHAADGVVNATPVGMANFPGTPFDTGLLASQQWVVDIVYFPLETALLHDARAIGCPTLDGSGMNILQAAAGFDIFTGLKADRHRLRTFFDTFEMPHGR